MGASRLRQIGASFGFLSILPVGLVPGPWSVVSFAAVGLAIGGIDALVFVGARASGSLLLAALLALIVDAVLTRGFHYDAVADTADALGAVAPRERRLEIMRDPRVGAFGVLALVLLVGVRATGIAGSDSWLVIVSGVVLGRLVMAGGLVALEPVRASSLAAVFAPGPRRPVLVTILLAECALLVAIDLWFVGAIAVLALALGVVAGGGLLAIGRGAFGGTTGDLLGAAGLVAETAVFVAAALAGFHGH